MDTKQVSNLNENEIVVECDSRSIPSKTREEPCADPVEEDPCSSAFEAECDVTQRMRHCGGCWIWRVSDQPSPDCGIDGKISAEEKREAEEARIVE